MSSTTPDARTWMPHRRFEALDGLRALAAIAVLVTHVGDATAMAHRTLHFGGFSYPLNGAVYELNLGVEVFFVISAFLVYRPFLAAHVDGGRAPGALWFLWRRAWRVYPAYWVALTVIVAISYKSLTYPHAAGGTTGLRLSHYFLYWGYDLRWVFGEFGLRQAWTLVVEMTFYLFVPVWALLMRGAGRWLGALRAEVIGALLLLPVSPWMVWNLQGATTPRPLRVLPPFLTAFAIGMLFAAIDVWHERRAEPHRLYEMVARRASWAWGVALVGFLVFVKLVKIDGVHLANAHQQTVERTMHAVLAGLLVLPAIAGMQRRDGVRKVLQWRPLVGLGVASYGFYLWHYLFIDSLRHKLDDWGRSGAHGGIVRLFADHLWFEFGAFFLIAFAGAAIIGMMSWLLIERPANNLARRSWTRLVRPAGAHLP